MTQSQVVAILDQTTPETTLAAQLILTSIPWALAPLECQALMRLISTPLQSQQPQNLAFLVSGLVGLEALLRQPE